MLMLCDVKVGMCYCYIVKVSQVRKASRAFIIPSRGQVGPVIIPSRGQVGPIIIPSRGQVGPIIIPSMRASRAHYNTEHVGKYRAC